ncbi:MAG: ribosome biogenesis GTP-binding protein YihA/YsxC [Desulfovibrionaceae bacterium]
MDGTKRPETREDGPNAQLILEKTVYTPGQLIDAAGEIHGPQVALAGRSNVGKSTLINCLAGQRKLAKISATPGKTRSLNYYRVRLPGTPVDDPGPSPLYLVDLPGYGYAKCSKVEREKWAKLIDAFLTRSRDLKAVAVLIDCRVEPQRLDLDMTDYVRSLGIPVIPVLTKADKCKQQEQSARQKQWQAILGGAKPILFSGKTGKGSVKLWESLFEAGGLSL